MISVEKARAANTSCTKIANESNSSHPDSSSFSGNCLYSIICICCYALKSSSAKEKERSENVNLKLLQKKKTILFISQSKLEKKFKALYGDLNDNTTTSGKPIAVYHLKFLTEHHEVDESTNHTFLLVLSSL